MQSKQLQLSLGVTFTIFLLSACAVSQSVDSKISSAGQEMVWPSPPATAKIGFVRSIATSEDTGIHKSMFRRLLEKITGGTDLHFVRPSGVAELDGVMYVADSAAHTVWILDSVNQKMIAVQRFGDTRLVSPVAVAVRADGAVFVADSVLARVLLLDRRGNYLGVVVEDGLQRPAGLAYNENNKRLYVADSAGQRIRAYDTDGKLLFSWGSHGSGEGQFNYPTHLAIGPQGEVLVTDALNFRIQSFDPDGKYLWQFGYQGDSSGTFAAPKGVAMDREQHVYVVDALFDTVQIFRKDGTFLLSFGNQGNGPGQFWLPSGVFINTKNHIFVADAYNHRIQEFKFLNPQAKTTIQQ